MPTPRFKLDVEPTSKQVDFDTLKALVSAQMVGKTGTIVYDLKSGAPTAFDVKLANISDLDSFKTWVTLNKTTLAALMVSGRASFHKCSHDDEKVLDCKNDSKSEYVEVVF